LALKVKEIIQSNYRTVVAMTYDQLMAAASFTFSIFLPFTIVTGDLNPVKNFPFILIMVLAVKWLSFYRMGLYRGIWRFSSTPDLVQVIKGVTLGVLGSFIVVFLYNRLENVPRTSFIIDWFILVVTLGGGRFSYRIWKDRPKNFEGTRVLVVGAGVAGVQLVREMGQNPAVNLTVVGFIDDDSRKKGKSLHGVNVIGKVSNLADIIQKESIQKVFIAIPSASSSDVRKIVQACQGENVEVQTLPALNDLLDGKVELSLLRKVRPEDLLGREPILLDQTGLGKMLSRKRVMVTGAGGSIGSELCHQIAKFGPELLILYEQSEFFLYELENKLQSRFPDLKLVCILGDIRNINRMEFAYKTCGPQVIFHAAAYKHVPMLESNPISAVNTNILGTHIVANLAHQYNAEKFVMISTDKAVNPTNVMGTTKRVAEMICQNIQLEKSSQTKFITVRFGNVLGSHGSVIPRFKEQIEQGGPVTVTHPEINRYFMSIPEASQLVLQAASMGKGGEIYVLDMGEPIKILDLAKQMIQLAGMRPYEDIDIQIIGLRPGEKLYEELLADEESTIATSHPKVRVANMRPLKETFSDDLKKITLLESNSSTKSIRDYLKKLVPEYKDQLGSSDGQSEDTSSNFFH